ncbi:MAG: adenylosuccinate lyase [Bacteroidales bacterium]|nr:MAG: adenylosuccinate lyase [Bacteroidales bacterium]
MNISTLTAISPIDGRYRNKTEELAGYFSEYALIKYRIQVEIEYFIELCLLPLPQLTGLDKNNFQGLRKIYKEFTVQDAEQIKNIEKITNHDIKAVEYFIKEKFDELNISEYKEFVHFGLTSQDINNTAVPLSFKDALNDVFHPLIKDSINILNNLADQWKSVSMLSKTHGQPATPTLLGKEIKVFIERLTVQLEQLKSIPFSAKFGGTVGNFNAHHVAYPEIDWIKFGNHLVNDILGLARTRTTTQIEHYDNLSALFDCLKRINTIIIDLNRDIWTYISMDYFKQKIKAGEVSSSTMPHKVNPIDFENSEGNLGVANAIYEHLSAKLPISRLQRDLTDSTVLRNIGVPVSHTVIALKSLNKGLGKLLLNEEVIKKDLDNNWSVVAEAIQTILRREGYPKPYEALKELTRTHKKMTRESIHNFIDTLKIGDKVKEELKKISPDNYTGIY